ncbi:MAG TPA: sigma-70 family RNA polymerase sigma factor [Candidatus Binatia bacterium]|jgi:RNA polymerase sigma-70 factor (ECF subfamily)|nr:sigma-70 family RNA polymerase sigma factor [Candidatus Binatia bacterium]
MAAESGDDPIRLIRQIADGNRDAFQRFYDLFASLAFTLAVRILRDRVAAEDLLQEAFFQLWNQAASYSQERGSPEAWVITIIRSRAIDKLRSIRRREKSFVPMERPGGKEYDRKVESGAEESEARLTVNSVLAQLPEAQRQVLEMAYFEGLTQSEIAERLKEPLGTVKTRIRTALTRLRELFGAKMA